ncbi:ribosomal RNA small subunit methyltransferase A [Amycolatopsis anabasis]|uniref:ribosomal RNA small subunit methyltransferase A n=1 Tax=Amycolatopsis anabasis TaxID=1840409 RepID=UPI001FE55813|nr:rRNA adenine N(6)-methyltransferase family protein [Amycolatopsis anabasis]
MPASGRRPAVGRTAQPNPSGVHFLATPRIVDGLLRSCPVETDDLVLDLGAGLGAITAPLARTGAKVVAVERDPEFVRRLRERFAGHGNVRVVTGDVRKIPLPHKAFVVVSSIPYAVSTALFRRLLNPRGSRLRRAALVVEWGFAKRVTSRVPRDAELAWWAARFDIRLVRRVPAACFSPAPQVDSAHLGIRREPGLGAVGDRALWTLLDAAYRAPDRPVRAVTGFALHRRNPHRVLGGCGIDPAAPAGTVPPRRWAELARILAEDRSLHWPRLPKALTERPGGDTIRP